MIVVQPQYSKRSSSGTNISNYCKPFVISQFITYETCNYEHVSVETIYNDYQNFFLPVTTDPLIVATGPRAHIRAK